MISISNIIAIAKYERVTLLRSWFFKIFSALAFFVLGMFNLAILVVPEWSGGTWIIRSIGSNIPYVNLLLLNVVQAVVAIFLASDFLKQDSKLDTTDVIYVRSMSNVDYVVGKTLGNIGVFLLLNILVLGMVMIMNMLSTTASLEVEYYLYYFFLISVPTLVFIMGASFMLMSLLKNQAITFVILLGYVAVSLFYLKSKYYYIFDYMAFSIPMGASDFVGFGNLGVILNHRGMYLFLGLSFICYTIMMLRRLSHSKLERFVSGALGTIFLLSSMFMGYNHIARIVDASSLRESMIARNDALKDIPKLTVNDYNIKLKHLGNQITVNAELKVENKTGEALSDIVFSLNPGLKLDSLLINGTPQKFEQALGVIETKNYTVANDELAHITFVYSGNIQEEAAYLDVPKEEREALYSHFLFQIDKRYAFLTSNYVLLTRENVWYPIPGAGFGESNKHWLSSEFSNYTLSVETSPKLTAISQGEVKGGDGMYSFENDHANSQLSLVIGEYIKMQKEVDGLEFNVYVKDGHDYFSEFFEPIKDTIPEVLSEVLQDYERSIDLFYPFDRFSLIEVPIQYVAYRRVLSGACEFAQPEMMLFNEMGATAERSDFEEAYRQLSSNRGWRRSQHDMTDEEKRIQILKDFVSTFTSITGRPQFSNDAGEFTVEETANPYHIFPLFYDHAYMINSSKWAVNNKIFAAYKASSSANKMGGWMKDMQGVTKDEKANLALLSQSFEELLNSPNYSDIINNVIELKGTTLFSIIKQKLGEEVFEDFLFNYLQEYKFKNTTIESFASSLEDEFGIDLISYMNDWFSSTNLPSYIIGNVEALNVLDGDEQKTMVQLKISNVEDTEGVVELIFRIGGGSRSGGNAENITKLIYFDANQTKDITVLVSGSPRGGTINTYCSKNIPSSINIDWGTPQDDYKIVPYESELLSNVPVSVEEPNEIIIDNEDPEFEILTQAQTSRLRELLLSSGREEEKYGNFIGWRPPLSWRLTTNSKFYGTTIRSAYYVASGSGNQLVKWNVPLRGDAFYDVYAYIYKSWGRNNKLGEYEYVLHHANGVEEIPVNVNSAGTGWYHMGAYYFTGDTAVVELSNKNSARMVVADAIKFIKQ